MYRTTTVVAYGTSLDVPHVQWIGRCGVRDIIKIALHDARGAHACAGIGGEGVTEYGGQRVNGFERHEWVDKVPRYVVANKVKPGSGMFTYADGFLVMFLALTILGVWLLITSWDSGNPEKRYYPVFFIILGSAFVIITAIAARNARVEKRSDRAIMEMDRVSMMKDDRVLQKIEFGKGVSVALVSKENSLTDVMGYVFGRGVKEIRIDVARGYLQDDVTRMLPLVKAAIDKHEMQQVKHSGYY